MSALASLFKLEPPNTEEIEEREKSDRLEHSHDTETKSPLFLAVVLVHPYLHSNSSGFSTDNFSLNALLLSKLTFVVEFSLLRLSFTVSVEFEQVISGR